MMQTHTRRRKIRIFIGFEQNILYELAINEKKYHTAFLKIGNGLVQLIGMEKLIFVLTVLRF